MFLRSKIVFSLALISLLTIFVYKPFLDNFFAADDAGWLWAGKHYTEAYFTFHPSKEFQVFRPVPVFFFHIMFKAYHTNPFPYFLSMALMHSVNACLFFFFTNAFLSKQNILKENITVCFFAAFCFGTFFLTYQTVAWLSCLEYLLMFFFYFSSLLLYLTFTLTSSKTYLVLSLACFILSLSSLETAATLPFILIAIEAQQSSSPVQLTKRIKTLLPFFITAALYSLFLKTYFYAKLPYPKPSFLNLSLITTMLASVFVFFTSLWANLFQIWSASLLVKPDAALMDQIKNILLYLVLFLVFSALTYARLLRDNVPSKNFKKIFFFFLLFIFINLFPPSIFDTKSLGDIFAITHSRKLYLASAGICVLFSIFCYSVIHMLSKNKAVHALLFLLLVFSIMSKNSSLLAQLDAYYEKASRQHLNFVRRVSQTLKEEPRGSILFFVDFKEEHKINYGIFLPQYLEIFYGKTADTQWVKESQLFSMKKKLAARRKNTYYIRFFKGNAYDATSYYRNLLK